MYFCPNCSYLFDISKGTSLSEGVDERKLVKKIPDLFKLLDNEEDMTSYKCQFPKEELTQNKRYQKLSDAVKDTLEQTFEKSAISGAELKCNNCNNTQTIKETLLLYQINMGKTSNVIKTLEENKFIAQDPLLPHTRDYECKNPNCITHKNKFIKEAVFYRDNNSFKVNYICTVCNFGW
jgi:hypothetical protein